jgi:acetylornithine deacetylase/succinyl-diaminopimelate desuccinylase-like protein
VGGQGQLAAQATALLQRLIRLNTVNPPGDERAAIEHLRDLLAGAGFECELLAAEPRRPNLVARLRPRADASAGAARGAAARASGERSAARAGAADGPTLCYLGHVDTVLANAEEWRRDPWSGDIADGCVWGRGALDMKSQVAAEVAAAVSLAREGWRPARGELLVVAVVDEETGGELGARWLCENHPERVRCDMLLNEGGGAHFELDGRRCYPVCYAEKGVFRFTVTTTGAAAHASMPALGDNALLKLAPVLERFASHRPEPSGVTFAPTMASASEKINVIPSQAELRVDCRVPPGLGETDARAAIEQVLGGIDGLALRFGEGPSAPALGTLRIDFTERIAGNGSPLDSPLMTALASWVAERDPGGDAVPKVFPGFTDSHHFRAAFPDCVAYGFFPQRHQSLPETQALMHAPDERIDLRDLALAADCYRELALRLLG